MEKHLHIIALNVPWPANYGGVIDIFYKLRALHAEGIKILLHCFVYDRPPSEELNKYCEQVFYYKRKTGLLSNLNLLPYNVYSRKDPALIGNLLKDTYPILFEGLHSCYYLSDPRLKNRFKVFRESNIEHDYYRELGKAESNPVKKCFYYLEAFRFRLYQKKLAAADLMLVVSMKDTAYLKREFPRNHIEFLPSFHNDDRITARTGKGDFILYHAKLSVKENEKAADYLIRHVFSRLEYPCVIAGMDPPPALIKAAAPYPNIRIEANPSQERMEYLIHEAQIHLLVTFQDTGLKLKLLNSLFAGRFTIANQMMVTGSGLGSLCHLADTEDEMVAACRELMSRSLTETDLAARTSLLFPTYSNREQAGKLAAFIFTNIERTEGTEN